MGKAKNRGSTLLPPGMDISEIDIKKILEIDFKS